MDELRWRNVMLLSKHEDKLYLGYHHNPFCYIISNPEIVTLEPGQVVEVIWYPNTSENRSYAKVYHIRLPQVIELPSELQGGEGSWLENRLNTDGTSAWYLVGENEGGFCEITYPVQELIEFLNNCKELKTDD